DFIEAIKDRLDIKSRAATQYDEPMLGEQVIDYRQRLCSEGSRIQGIMNGVSVYQMVVCLSQLCWRRLGGTDLQFAEYLAGIRRHDFSIKVPGHLDCQRRLAHRSWPDDYDKRFPE